MSKNIFVVGLGNMGAALAKTLLETGHQVTVWNRTASPGRGTDQGRRVTRRIRD